MIRERVGGLDAAVREAMSRSICRRVSSLGRGKNFRRVAVFAARPGEVDLLSLLDLLPDREWYFPLVHEGRIDGVKAVRRAADGANGRSSK